jgi:fructosamine-3-kinase
MSADSLAAAFDAEDLRAAAARALGAIDEPATAIDAIRSGNRKLTAVARFADHSPVVVQVCGEQTWLRSEATLLTQIGDRTAVPVPPVLAAGTHDGVAYMVTAHVAGEDLHERFAGLSSTRQRDLARSFGTHLAQLHRAFRFDGYGTLEVTDGELTPPAQSWPSWFAAYARNALDRLPPAFDPLQSALRDAVSQQPADAAPIARLFPWDFRPGNALLADGDLAAVLDWEAPLAAPAALSVAKTEYLVADWYVDDPDPLRDAFRDGYVSVRPYPDVRPAHRVVAIADSAVDSTGAVTNPRYPELGREDAVTFHRRALEGTVDRTR